MLILNKVKTTFHQAPKFGGNNRSVIPSLPQTWNGGNDFSLPSIFLSEKTMP